MGPGPLRYGATCERMRLLQGLTKIIIKCYLQPNVSMMNGRYIHREKKIIPKINFPC